MTVQHNAIAASDCPPRCATDHAAGPIVHARRISEPDRVARYAERLLDARDHYATAVSMLRGALWSDRQDEADDARDVLRALDLVTLAADPTHGNSGPGGAL